MFNSFRLKKPQFLQSQLQPNPRTVISRLLFILVGSLALVITSHIIVARIGATPMIIEPPPAYIPGHALPTDVRCGIGDAAEESCYPPVDAHCYESGDSGGGCVSSAAIQYDGKKITLLIDIAARTIALTSVAAPGYTVGDLILAWGTPTGFSRFGRDIDVYWGARSTSLTTCLFRPESHVDVITFYRNAAYAAPWHGFVRINSKEC